MLTFELVLNLLMCLLERHFTGRRFGHWTKETVVADYANDVTIIVTAPADIYVFGDLTVIYERTTGARLNIRKSKVMVTGSWDKSMNILGRPHYKKITILGFRFTSAVALSGNVTWLRTKARSNPPEREA